MSANAPHGRGDRAHFQSEQIDVATAHVVGLHGFAPQRLKSIADEIQQVGELLQGRVPLLMIEQDGADLLGDIIDLPQPLMGMF